MAKSTIISLLSECDKTTGHIVSKLGVSYNAVYQTMDGKATGSRRIRLEIARLLNKSPSFIWGNELSKHTLLVDDYEYMQMMQQMQK